MFIEIRKAGFINKGAELMLYAALQKLKTVYPDAEYVMVPSSKNGIAPYSKRAKMGLLQKAWHWRYGLPWGDLAIFAPKIIREMYGIVLDKEINIVIDVAGFSYTDQWPISHVEDLARSCKRWRKQNTKVILLPQAFGPFKSAKIKKLIKIAADNSDLIFARDPISYQCLKEVVGERSNIRMAPDFTNLLNGFIPDYFNINNNRFCLVPNYRMIDKTPMEQSEAYISFMIKCVHYLIKKNQKPFVLIHEGPNDKFLAQKISEFSNTSLPIIQEDNPLKIKGIIGTCQGLIGSRFHSLVNALCQGVPSLGTGWSHKYKMLFHEYGFDDGMIDVTASDKEICKKIDMIIDPISKNKIKGIINTKSNEIKKLSEDMWIQVFKVLGVS